MYELEYSLDAIKSLKRMPRNVSLLIRQKIESVADDPRAPNNNVRALKGRSGFRLRVGDWRVIYEIDTARRTIRVLAVAARGRVYQ